jgi:hypothetical protein
MLLNVIWINPLNAELNPVLHLLALVGARHIVHVSRIRVNLLSNSLIVFLCSFLMSILSN